MIPIGPHAGVVWLLLQLPKILELVGVAYTGWFVYRYLLFKVDLLYSETQKVNFINISICGMGWPRIAQVMHGLLWLDYFSVSLKDFGPSLPHLNSLKKVVADSWSCFQPHTPSTFASVSLSPNIASHYLIQNPWAGLKKIKKYRLLVFWVFLGWWGNR